MGEKRRQKGKIQPRVGRPWRGWIRQRPPRSVELSIEPDPLVDFHMQLAARAVFPDIFIWRPSAPGEARPNGDLAVYVRFTRLISVGDEGYPVVHEVGELVHSRDPSIVRVSVVGHNCVRTTEGRTWAPMPPTHMVGEFFGLAALIQDADEIAVGDATTVAIDSGHRLIKGHWIRTGSTVGTDGPLKAVAQWSDIDKWLKENL